MRVALDTNVLAYAEGVNGAERRTEALAVLAAAGGDEVTISAQVLCELYMVLTRKAGRPAAQARAAVGQWAASFEVSPVDAPVVADAMELADAHRIAFWDAVVLAAAAGAGCRRLLTEDMQAGFAWRGVVVTNPFPVGTRGSRR